MVPIYEHSKRICTAASVLAMLLLIGCGGQTSVRSNHTATQATGTIHVGTHLIYTGTRTTAEGATETVYIHPDTAVSEAKTRHVLMSRIPHFGLVLVDGGGYALYAFMPDRSGPAACVDTCAKRWPPLRITIEGTVDASPLLKESLVGTKLDPENHRLGDRVVKFAGRVVHTYRGDTAPGMTSGQGLYSYGGRWYLISPSGKLVTGVGR